MALNLWYKLVTYSYAPVCAVPESLCFPVLLSQYARLGTG